MPEPVSENGSNNVLLPADPAHTLLPELPPEAILSEKRGPKSFKLDAESSGETTEEEVGASDESVVEAEALEVQSNAQKAINGPEPSIELVTQVAGPGGEHDSSKIEDAKKVVKQAKDEKVADFDVDTAKAEEATVVETDDGDRSVVVLKKGEKSREVKIGDDTVLVLNSELSVEEAREETSKFISNKIRTIASDHGLGIDYDGLLGLFYSPNSTAVVDFVALQVVDQVLYSNMREALNDDHVRNLSNLRDHENLDRNQF